jgi:hypothetical protein
VTPLEARGEPLFPGVFAFRPRLLS